MFKNSFKRSFLSIRRKWGRTVVLALIFFMMANLVLAAITIKTAVKAQMDYAKSSLGGSVTIQADMESIRENQKNEIEEGGDPREMFSKMTRPSVSVEIANEIAGYSDYVKDYSYELGASANSYDLETVESTSRSGKANMPGGMGMPGAQQENDDDAALDADITIAGINAYAYIDDVESGALEIKDGTYFDEDSENAAMISYEFAELNGLSVGDSFELKNIYTEKSVSLTVIGIYDTSEGRANANTIYMNIDAAAYFLSEDDYNGGNFDVDNVTYYMLDNDKAEEFVEKVNADFPELAENKLKIAVDASEYDSVSSSIESVGSFATTILVIVIVAAIIIVTLIVTINVKDRNYEMGVLLSLGATKANIVLQIATELVIVGTLGFTLACASGTVLAQELGNSILESQVASSAQQSEKNFGRPGAQVGSGQMLGERSGENMPSVPEGENSKKSMKPQAQTADIKLDINAKPIDFLLLFVTGYLVIILALILPAVNILRYQPKQILAGKE